MAEQAAYRNPQTLQNAVQLSMSPGVIKVLTTKTLLGASWAVSSRLAGRLTDFVTLLVLARALTPADFGLTAIALTLIVIVETVLEVPLIVALTRLKRITKAHLDTAFTLGVLRGILLSLVVLLAAWPFSHIYNDDRLMTLIAVLTAAPIARSLYSPSMVKYVRQLSFRQGFIAEFLGKIIASIVAISVAYLGGGYWAIAAGTVSGPVANTLITYLVAPYRPTLSLARFSEFSTFLGWFSTAQVASTLSWQFDRVLLGYSLTKSDLGQYTMASDLSALPTQSMIGPAMQPLIAAFSRIHDNQERLRSAYLKASRFTMLLAAPTCIGMSLTSDMIVDVLLGSKWTEAAIYLQWLALSTVLNAYYQPLHALALATNRTELVFRLSLVDLCSRIFLVSVGLYLYSVPGVIASRGAISLIMFIFSLLTARYLIGIRVASEVGNLSRVAAACATMALLVLVLRHELDARNLNMFIELSLTAAFGAAVYICSLLLLGVRFKDYLPAGLMMDSAASDRT